MDLIIKKIGCLKYIFSEKFNTVILHSKTISVTIDCIQIGLFMICTKTLTNVVCFNNDFSEIVKLISFDIDENIMELIKLCEGKEQKLIDFYETIDVYTPVKRFIVKPK